VTIDGAGSKWTTGNLLLGDSGRGNLTISNGGSLVTTVMISGQTAAIGAGNATVTGSGSSWEITGNYNNTAMSIGLNGANHVPGNLSVLAGGNVTIDPTASDPTLADVRLGVSSPGNLLVDGAGSHFTTPYNFFVGFTANQTGTVVVSNGGNLTTGFSVIANQPNASATDSVTVTGAGSIWTIKDTPTSVPSAAQGLDIGEFGPGSLTIANGGTVTLANLTAHVLVGSGSLNIGAAAASPAAAPGTLNAKDIIFTTGSPGSVNFNHTSTNYVFAPQITGAGPGVVNIIAGTTIFTADDTYAGNTTISPGATLQLGNAGATGSISGNATDNGALIFNRTTAFTVSGNISGSGNLTQAGSGVITLHGAKTYAGGTVIDSGATLQVGDVFADASIIGPVDDEGALAFFRTADAAFAGNISGAGNLTKQGFGNLTLSGNNTYSGVTTVAAGRLIATGGSAIGDQSTVSITSGSATFEAASSETIGALSGFGHAQIDSGAVLTTGANGSDSTYSGNISGVGNLTKVGAGNFTLTGISSYSGATIVTAGDLFVNGNLASPTVSVQNTAALGGTGNLAGAVTVANGGTLIGHAGSVLTMGALTLNPTSNINVSLGAPSTAGLFQVNGALTLDGNLNITDAGGFGAGTYRLINYTGPLTDNGLSIGTAPAGNLTVQTSIANQVNLIFTAPSLGSIEFWNGTTTSPTGTVVGGAGTWSIGPNNWTNASGNLSGPWNSGMAIFEATPGAVTVDDSAGLIQATDIQFAVDGYSVGGGNLTLTGPTPTIRVGDGTGAGAGYTATVSAPILGTGGLIKTDLGTLVLSGTNTYTGGTTIDGGNLSVGADANLGNSTGSVTLDGGNLTVTGSFSSARTVDIEAAGTITIGSGDTLNLTGNLTDTAALTKSGTGVLEISGTSAYAGALGVAAGTLEVNGSLGAATVTVQSAATLEGNGTLGGPVSIANGGHLVGVDGQTLTMGALSLNPTSNLDVSLGAPTSTGLFKVNGALTLDGTLNITDAGGFGAGTYRVIDYTGALTNNGLAIGTVPAGVFPGILTVQTSVADQVNLIYAAAGPIQFWNGTTTSPTGTVVGGAGTWKLGPTNWTDAAGDTSGNWTGGMAIFEGTAGAVTVDDTAGSIQATDIQFAVTGYTVGGGNLTLTGGAPTVRVGDGTGAGAGYTATISSAILGTGGLIKTDLGTLVLSGTNTYTGGTTIQGGTLSVGADTNLGGAGNLTLDGGNLTVTGSFSSARLVDVEAAGTINIGSGDTLNLTGNLTDAAALTKSGAGVLEISGASAYAGALGVAAGTLEVNASLGAATLTVQSAATLEGTGTLGGPVSIANGGHLVGVEGQTLTMGALTLNPTSNLDVSLGAPGTTQLFQVNGALTLDGNLNITDAGGFGAGTYRIIDYTGALTDNGLSIGTAPAGNLTVQTSVANQVNLVFTTASSGPLQFWNGSTLTPTGTVVGGNGTWKIGPTNWTDAAGDTSGTWTTGFAIFQGAPGTVTIDNSGGAIAAAGLQFAVSGYTVAGGNLTLSGAAPTIRVGDGTAAGAGDTATISAPIAGTNGLIKTDLGTLVLTGASSLSGGSTVAAGRLAVEGSLANSAVTVASGATLGGNGVVGGVVAQAGAIVAPGDSIGALSVSGNYSQAAGSTYQVELDAAGHADRINVSGAASLASGAVLDVIKTDAAPYVFGTRYTVLSAAGGVTGTYTLTGDTIPVTPFIGLVANYDANDVYLDVAKIRTFASAGATPNEIAAGHAADDLPLANTVANVLANLPTIAAAQAAFNQVSGEIHASVRGAMIEDGRTLRDGVIDHLITLADGDPGVWGEAVTGSRRLNGDGNAASASGSDTTLMAGLDNAFGPVILGVVGGYETGGLGVDARASSANLQGWHVAAYGQADLGKGWGLRGVGGYSGWTADISRMISLPGLSNRLSSRDSAGEGQAYAELGWTAHLGMTRVQPFIGAGWSWLQGSSFAERGGAAALKGHGLALDVGSGKAGVRLDADWRSGGVTIRPHATLAWELGFDGRLPLVDVGFPDSGSGAAYAVSGPALSRNRADVDLGVDLTKGGFTLGAGFIGQYADRASQEGFNAHVDWNF
jgi:fibronectin-binding autotransporter adhesin